MVKFTFYLQARSITSFSQFVSFYYIIIQLSYTVFYFYLFIFFTQIHFVSIESFFLGRRKIFVVALFFYLFFSLFSHFWTTVHTFSFFSFSFSKWDASENWVEEEEKRKRKKWANLSSSLLCSLSLCLRLWLSV